MSDRRSPAPARPAEPSLRSGSYEPKRSSGSPGAPIEEEHTRLRRERMERRDAERKAREIEMKKKNEAEGIRAVRTSSVPPALRKQELQQADAKVDDQVETRYGGDDPELRQVPGRQDVADIGEKGGRTAQEREPSVFHIGTPGDRTPTQTMDTEDDEEQIPGFGVTLARGAARAGLATGRLAMSAGKVAGRAVLRAISKEPPQVEDDSKEDPDKELMGEMPR